MLVGNCSGDVQRSQQGEDVRLQTFDKEFEEGQTYSETKGERAHDLEHHAVVEHVIATHDEDEQQKVPGEHVGEKTNGEGKRTNDEVGGNLEWREDYINPFWDARHESDVFEVLTKTMLANTYVVIDHVGENHERYGESETRHRGELHERHNSEDVVDDDKSEESEEERHELHEFVTDDVFAEIFLYERVNALAEELRAGRNHRSFLR